MAETTRYLFGEAEFDTATFQLKVEGRAEPLEPKALDVLRLLLERAPAVVDKNDIFAAVWKDVAVTDNALTRIVVQIRKALRDDAKNPRYIATVSTRGYRVVVPVTTVAEGVPPSSEPDATAGGAVTQAVTGRPRRRIAYAIGFSVMTLAAVATARWQLTGRERIQPASISSYDVATMAAAKPAQMTSGTGFEGFLSYSPDGTSIAFSSDRTGALEVYAQVLAPGAVPTALTANGRQNIQPAWSPDGRFIAYHEMAGDGIWIVPSRGGVARQVASFGAHPSWSPDGRQIAFQSASPADLNPGGAFGSTSTIWMVRVDATSQPEALTRPGVPSGSHGMPVWWPTGRRIVFAVNSQSGRAIAWALWTIDADGGGLRPLIDHETVSPEFALGPDGRSILFSARGTHAIWRVRMTASGDAAGAPEPTGLPVTGSALSHIAISPDGRHVAWTANTSSATVWSAGAPPDSAAPSPLLRGDAVGWRAGYPSVAADGRVAFIGNRGNNTNQVYIANADGSARQISTDGSDHGGPFWLDGDREIAVIADHGSGPGYFALDPESGRERLLFRLADIKPPDGVQSQVRGPGAGLSLTADMSRVAVAFVQGGVPNIWTAALGRNGQVGRFVQRTQEKAGGSFGVWSRDAKWIAYECNDGPDINVCVADADGGNRRQLTDAPGHSFIGGWLADNDHILVAERHDAVWNVVSISRQSGEQRALTFFTEPRFYVRYPRWDTAGKRVIFERFESAGRIWSVDLPPAR